MTTALNEHPESRPIDSPGCLGELVWLGAGLALPWVSRRFYRLAVRRRLLLAGLFFVLFELAITGLMTISLGKGLFSATRQVRSAFESGRMPDITIQDGVASVDAQQPFIIYEGNGSAFILDTTGTITELDRSRYSAGILLTRTSVHILSQSGRYQEMPLGVLQEALGTNPLLINAGTTTRYWIGFSVIFTALALVALALWNTLGRFMALVTLGVLIWGVVSLLRPGTGFGPVLVTGLYALVPATYLHYLLGLAGVKFFGLHTLLLFFVWAIALWAALSRSQDEPPGFDLTRRMLQLVVATPLLLAMSLNVIFDWPRAAWALWLLTLFTLVALLVLELWKSRTVAELEKDTIEPHGQ